MSRARLVAHRTRSDVLSLCLKARTRFDFLLFDMNRLLEGLPPAEVMKPAQLEELQAKVDACEHALARIRKHVGRPEGGR
jgi:hypothetical protein